MNKGISINCPSKYNFINIIMKIIKYIWIIIPVGIIIYGIVEFIINIGKIDIKDKSNRIPKLLKKMIIAFIIYIIIMLIQLGLGLLFSKTIC